LEKKVKKGEKPVLADNINSGVEEIDEDSSGSFTP
jgi:hypothetical protein